MDKMPWSEVKQVAEEFSHLDSGRKVRTNHNSPDCTGNSNSMIVERKHDGSLSIHCFRCGRSGYHRGSSALKSIAARITGEGGVSVVDRKYRIPRDCTTESEEWPSAARVFIRRARLTEEEVKKYDISWSESEGRIVIPVGLSGSGADVSVASFQTRRILPSDTKPKYLTYKNRNCVFGIGSGESVVLVEDVLSAIRVGRFMPAIALLGVKLQPHHLQYIMKAGFKKFYVFLDDDNLQVKLNQLKMSKQLSLFGQVEVIHNDGVDPKEMSDVQLKNLLL